MNYLIKNILKFVGVFILIIALVGTYAAYKTNQYLASNETKILDNLGFLQSGQLSFESTTYSLYKNFPEATISLKNVQIKDSLFDQGQAPLIQVGELQALLSLADLWHQKIAVQTLRFQDGAFNIWKDQKGRGNIEHLLQIPPKSAKEGNKRPFWKDIKLKAEKLKLVFINMNFLIKDAIKTNHIKGNIKHLQTELDLKQENLAARIDLNLGVDHLIFKQKNGAFLSNSEVSGVFDFTYSDTSLVVFPFDLKINDLNFWSSANINLKKEFLSELVFETKSTRLKKVIPLLNPITQRNLRPYQIESPFYAKTTIKTDFQPDNHPIVEVNFQLDNQNVLVHNIPLNRTKLKGQFINRIYKDKRQLKEGKKRFRLTLEKVSTKHQDFFLQTDLIQIKGTKHTAPTITMAANIFGKAAGISDWFNNDQFFFGKGDFSLFAKVDAPLNDMDCILIETDADLKFNDFSVVYDPANVTFPFSEMSLEKKKGDAFFTIRNTTFLNGYDLLMDGGVKNLPALLLDLANQKTTSQASIYGEKLTWTDFLNFFDENGFVKNKQKKTERQKKRSMKTTVRGLFNNFEPSLSIKIDTLAYYDLLRLEKFQTGLHFEDENTLILEKTSFEYDGGTVDFSGKLDISQAHQTPFEFELTTKKLNLKNSLPALNYLNINLLESLEALPENLNLTIQHQGVLDDEKGLLPNSSTGRVVFETNDGEDLKGVINYCPIDTAIAEKPLETAFGQTNIQLSGNPKVFNSFFKTEKFFFKDGSFDVSFEYQGNLQSINEILAEGNATLTLKNSEVFYKPVGVTFPLTEIDLQLKNDTASFDFNLHADSLHEKIHLAGKLINLSELVIGNTNKILETEVDISSTKITWEQFVVLFASDQAEEGSKTASMKASVNGILNTFNPHFHVVVDTFIYSDELVFKSLNTGVYLKDSTIMVIEKSAFGLQDGHIQVNGEFDLGQKLLTPFSTNIQTINLDLKQLVKSLNYLALPSLKNMKKLDGKVKMDFDLTGVIDDNKGNLIGNASTGNLKFDLREVVVIGFEPLEAIAARMGMEERFQELRFGPIAGDITIDGQEIHFPQLEIQSNAIHLFMEGTLSYGDLTNIWVSIPLNNLRRTNRWIIPEKTGYAAAKRKVYIEVTSDVNGANKFKFRLLKRRFYKHRGILDQYKLDRKRDRAIRKGLRKNKTASLTEIKEVSFLEK